MCTRLETTGPIPKQFNLFTVVDTTVTIQEDEQPIQNVTQINQENILNDSINCEIGWEIVRCEHWSKHTIE